jgi:hypothetical protein
LHGLVKFETNFYADLYSNRPAIFGCGFKAPLLNRFNGFLVEAHAEPSLHADVVRLAVRTDDHGKYAGSFIFVLTGLLGILGVGRRNWFRREYAAPDAKDAAANTATPALTDAGTCALSNAAARARANTAAGSRSIGERWIGHCGRSRVSEVGKLGRSDLNLRRSDNGWLDSKLRMLVPHDDGRRSDLLHAQLRQTTLRRGKFVMIATTAASTRFLYCWGKHIHIRGRCDQRNVLRDRLWALHLSRGHRGQSEHARYYHYVQDGGNNRALFSGAGTIP